MNLKDAVKKLNILRTKKDVAYTHKVHDALSYATSTTGQSSIMGQPFLGTAASCQPGSYTYVTIFPAVPISSNMKLYLIATQESAEESCPNYVHICLLAQDGGFYDVETGEGIDLQANRLYATEMSLATIAKRIRESSTGE